MKLLALVVLVLLALPCVSRAGAPPEPQCAFADERTMTLLGIYTIAAEHYVARHAWPESRAELRAQARHLLPAHQADAFLARFSRLDLRRQGRDLRLSVRFRAAGRVYRQSAVLHPRESVDAILQAATDPDAA